MDDEALQLNALKRVLHGEPVEVVTFENPLTALDEIGKGGIDVVLSDNLMPGMSGMELFRKLHSSNSAARRILLTGATDMNDAVEALAKGIVHGFLNKPWNKSDLVELVRRELRALRNESVK